MMSTHQEPRPTFVPSEWFMALPSSVRTRLSNANVFDPTADDLRALAAEDRRKAGRPSAELFWSIATLAAFVPPILFAVFGALAHRIVGINASVFEYAWSDDLRPGPLAFAWAACTALVTLMLWRDRGQNRRRADAMDTIADTLR